ncbi:linoleate 9S-lipoxygenase 6-like [Mercurialis annua]|uniref:linoleate 9S-lipoxygenase 6-like n=1 Tax=Mercurialis annua TaxID=3986 RepID=UPI00215F67BD|nr:linoleate 9S-lipoxygenase 6-like [Mercurialis annua]
MGTHSPSSSLHSCMGTVSSKILHPTKRYIVKGKFVVQQNQGRSGPGKSASIQIYSSTEIDPSTGKGKLSEKVYLKHAKSKKHDGIKITTYQTKLRIEQNFGIPGALLVTNKHKHEFFLESAALEFKDRQTIHFHCRSWVYPVQMTKSARLFFSTTCYLPKETPNALVELRKLELESLRGDGIKERSKWDRIYDYDYYNDLGRPDKSPKHTRLVLGGSEAHPYPRRARTGCPPSSTDPSSGHQLKTIDLDVYVPPDEQLSPKKLSDLTSNIVQAAVHFLIPEAKSLSKQDSGTFKSFDEIRGMFTRKRSRAIEGKVAEKLKKLVPDELFEEIVHASKQDLNIPLPQILSEKDLAWRDDEEFGHQMLAGVNPTRIQCLQRFPPEGKNGESKIKVSDIEHNLDGLDIYQAMYQWRMLVLDHHDYLMPFLGRMNKKGVCAYASRTLFFLRDDSTLKPVAIELSLPGSLQHKEVSRVFLPASEGTEAALWQLAKAHVASNDSAYHQLISHWLHTHAVIEPFVIASRRQLSVMHPIHRLLDPHFKDTIHVNALARRILINSGGILEKTLFTGEISMELSAELYKDWRFDEQALPADLLKRQLALEDPDSPTGVQLLFEDYPYGADGLEVWRAIKTWVTDYCSIFYRDDDSVKMDIEIQAWWTEVKNVGHGDKHNETWWYEMTTISNLIKVITTLVWITSAFHASVNFGQYAYASYPPNRPMLCRKFIPKEGGKEFAKFLIDPDKFYLNMLPERYETALGIALTKVLSQHSSDEEYLGQRPFEWTDNKEVQLSFEKFTAELKEIEKKICERNENPRFRNRWGTAKIPYKFLDPDTSNVQSKGGITGKGIPNSISI